VRVQEGCQWAEGPTWGVLPASCCALHAMEVCASTAVLTNPRLICELLRLLLLAVPGL
jgi:hypothetical protein